MSEEDRNDVNEDVIEDVIEDNGASTAKTEPLAEEPSVNALPVAEEPPLVTDNAVVNEIPWQESGAEAAKQEETYETPKSKYNDGSTGRAIAALVLGICAICFSFTLMMGIFSLACGIVGLVLSIKERKAHPGSFATAAFIICLIGLIAGALSTVACIACMGFYGWAAYMSEFNEPKMFEMFNSMNI